jgi:hypothetical protein
MVSLAFSSRVEPFHISSEEAQRGKIPIIYWIEEVIRRII